MAKSQSSAFPATRWSLVSCAGSVSSESGYRALGELLELYRPVLVSYLISAGRFPDDRAEDLVQAFVHDKILEGQLIRQADSSRGKFRTFLLTSLNRYAIDTIRRERTARRHPGTGGLLPYENLEHELRDEHTQQRSFDVEWARQIIARTLEEVRRECEQKNRDDIWQVFHARVASPILSGAPPASYESLVGKWGLDSPRKAQNALITGKRMFQRRLYATVKEFVEDEKDTRSEIAEFFSICFGN